MRTKELNLTVKWFFTRWKLRKQSIQIVYRITVWDQNLKKRNKTYIIQHYNMLSLPVI
jgi:hypothetical protein